MTGVAISGAEMQLNALGMINIPVVSGSAPTGTPGKFWIDTGSGNAVKTWNGTAFVLAVAPYLALLTADPTGVTTIAGLAECTDSGYARQQVTFSAATAGPPAQMVNSTLIQFGAFTVNMSQPCQWLALVSVSSGTTGLLLNTWTLNAPQQVLATQFVDIAPGVLEITTS